jgi:hypothetical protein
MDYQLLARMIVDYLDKAQQEHKVYQYTMYYWLPETTEYLAKILERLLKEDEQGHVTTKSI